MPFDFKPTNLADVIEIIPQIFPDERGFFYETYKATDFRKNGINEDFVQDNHSLSKLGVLRGIHFQYSPKAQGKLIRVINGKVWDVAVDLRKNSSSFKKWISVEISAEKANMLYIPPGFGHGFLALTENVHLVYKCTEEYSKEFDGGIRFDDTELAILWPMVKDKMIISKKDQLLPTISEIDFGRL